MENRIKKAKSSSSQSNYLPPEIWTQILSSLPAKTVLKFRCVCKTWRSIINHPDFVHFHFQLCKVNAENNNKKLFVALEDLGLNGYEGWLLTVRQAITLRKTGYIFGLSNKYKYHVLGSCNGLLFVVQYDDSFQKPAQYRLWNPSICKSLVLPKSPFHNYLNRTWHLFGFAPYSQDYKVVVFTYSKIEDTKPVKVCFAVYTLRDQQWTVRNDPVNVTNLNFPNTAVAFQYLSTAFYVRGKSYWLGQNVIQSKEFLTHLCSFDLDKENVTFLELPSSPDETDSMKFLFLLEGSLAVFRISKVISRIWVLEQDNRKGPWTLWFSGKSSCDGYNLFRNGLLKKIYYYEMDGGYFVYGNKVYNIVSCQVQELNKSMSSCLILEEYSESLVLSKEFKARNLRNDSDRTSPDDAQIGCHPLTCIFN
ncbi:F-box/kelch-repeat protein At3g23880-like [Silene latifolia]|uniref:F-box/kelch-repeat protein At3g23880-like n=1 Tax=Silene latifolia TaxID=37657 RepID=UPI003D78762E